jgi:hypothetical protein
MPGKGARFPIDKGEFVKDVVADPVDNSAITWAPPANMIVRPLTCRFKLTSFNAGVARPVWLEFQVPAGAANRIWADRQPVDQAINTQRDYYAFHTGSKLNLILSDNQLGLAEVYLTSSDRLVVDYGNKNAGDRLTAFNVCFLQWRDLP